MNETQDKQNDRDNKVKEIVVVSGKGGTGKTTVTSSMAEVLNGVMMADADVEAANWHLLLHPRNKRDSEFAGKSLAAIDEEKCTGCGACEKLCRFGAISIETREKGQFYTVDPLSCDGCGLCKIACPAKAISMEPQTAGRWFEAETESGPLVYARLEPGGENSGHLVALVKKEARAIAEKTGKKTLVVDGPPGIGCPVIAALSGADFVIVVTEPTVSGFSDLERILKLIRHFQLSCGVVINRFDINPSNSRTIGEMLKKEKIPLLASIPHDYEIIQEISRARVPVHRCIRLREPVEIICSYLTRFIINN